MRPWHENRSLTEQEINESFADSMKESGLDPENKEDRLAHLDQVNREAYENGRRDRILEIDYDDEPDDDIDEVET